MEDKHVNKTKENKQKTNLGFLGKSMHVHTLGMHMYPNYMHTSSMRTHATCMRTHTHPKP